MYHCYQQCFMSRAFIIVVHIKILEIYGVIDKEIELLKKANYVEEIVEKLHLFFET